MATGLKRRRGIVSLVVFATLALASVGSAAETLLPPPLEVAFDGTVKPRNLPARKAVPISLHLSARIGTEDRSSPPGLRELRLAGDRQISLSAQGLPACGARGLPDVPPPWKKCADAMVGWGEAVVELHYPESRPIDVTTELAVYNAGSGNGVTRLWIHGYMPIAEPGPIVVPVKVRKIDEGRYGWEAVASVPVLNEGFGSIVSFNLTLRKRIVSARCRRSLQGRVTASFSEGTVMNGAFVRSCDASS
jgi:hypothetical protein